MEQQNDFVSECQALFERHKVMGFFAWTGVEDHGRMHCRMRADRGSRNGVLIGTQELAHDMQGRFAQTAAVHQARRVAEGSARTGGAEP